MIRIIMCTYNGEQYLAEQIESIFANTYSDFKLYISDDNSTDSTMNILNAYRQRHPDKIVVETNHTKDGAAKHFLQKIIDISSDMETNDFLMLCDQDDVWYKDKIEISLQYMQNLIKNVGNDVPLAVCSDVEVVDEKLNQIASSFRHMNNYSIKKLDMPHLMMENKVQGCTLMMNKSLVSQIQEIPEYLSMHDAWIGLLASAFGKISYIDKPTMAYRQHSKNVKGSASYKQIIISQLKNLSAQKYIVYDSTLQMREFLRLYSNQLDDNIKNMLTAFATLEQQGFIKRRVNIIKYGMWKTGLIRNIGLMVLI